jgi:hypothetical protein
MFSSLLGFKLTTTPKATLEMQLRQARAQYKDWSRVYARATDDRTAKQAEAQLDEISNRIETLLSELNGNG